MSLRSAFRVLSPACMLAASLVMVGCGAGSRSLTPSASLNTLGGKVHGGPNPVVGALVTLYATTSGGYGAPATPLGTAVTGNDGSFTFVAPLPCTSGQQAYMTAQGGNPGLPGSGTNPNYLLMAALGPCANISASTVIFINEVTTVAAAEALRPFTSITSASGVYTVNVGAPANNNAVTGICTLSGTATTGCVAAGLSHAFANALNLANSVSLNGVNPNGQAYAVAPSNPGSQVPQALINTLANALQGCVNSAGGTSGGSMCGNLFAATTPPVTSGVAPTNTLQAALNVAQYPALTPTNVTNLFGTVPPASYYQPTLSSAPADYSVAIGYSGVTVPGTLGGITITNPGAGYTAVPTVTISAPDTPGGTQATAIAGVHLATLTVVSQPTNLTACKKPVVSFMGQTTNTAPTITTGGGTGAPVTVTISNPGAGITSAVQPVFTPAANCGTGSQLLATYALDDIEVTNEGSGYTSVPTVTIVPAGGDTGTITTATVTANSSTTGFGAPYVIALDANDNVYVSSQNILAGSGDYAFVSSIGSNGSSNFASTGTSTTLNVPRSIAIDTLGHVYVSSNSNKTGVLQYNTSDGSQTGVTLTTTTQPFGVAVDRQNNVWIGLVAAATSKLQEFPQASLTGPGTTAITFTTPSNFTDDVRALAFDANQNVYVDGYSATENSVGVFPNLGTAAAPSYGAMNSSSLSAAIGGLTGQGIALDASSNIWEPSTTGLNEVATAFCGVGGATGPNCAVGTTGVTPATLTLNGTFTEAAATPMFDSVDGAGNVWIPNAATTGPGILAQYIPSSGTSISLSPCSVPASATTCAAAFSQPQQTIEDSTGAIWVVSLANGLVYQVLGPGAPTWPQLSLGAPGVMPQ